MEPKQLSMNCGKEENQLSNIFICLEASVISWQIMSKEERLIPRVMKESFQVIP